MPPRSCSRAWTACEKPAPARIARRPLATRAEKAAAAWIPPAGRLGATGDRCCLAPSAATQRCNNSPVSSSECRRTCGICICRRPARERCGKSGPFWNTARAVSPFVTAQLSIIGLPLRPMSFPDVAARRRPSPARPDRGAPGNVSRPVWGDASCSRVSRTPGRGHDARKNSAALLSSIKALTEETDHGHLR